MRVSGILVVALVVLTSVLCLPAYAALINYQGKLTDAGDQPVNATVSMRFSIYDSPEGGSQLWYETQGSVVVTNGIYSVLLGSSEAIPEEVFGSDDRWLGIRVAADPEMTPRQRIASVAFAVNSDMVDGKHASELGGGGHSLDAADGSPTDAVYVDTEGRVGIGKTDPSQKLDVAGTVRGVSATGNSIRGEMTGGSGTAVFGEATATGNSTNYGGWFESAGNYGAGVYGKTTGTSGWGVIGTATATGYDVNYGGWFQSAGVNGRGVYAEATGSVGKAVEGKATNNGDYANYGGWFSALGKYGAAVHGEANASGDHTTYGGEFISYSDKGRGVYGEATAYGENAENYGGYFKANGGDGKGVYGEGNAYGVYGKSSSGYGVYSEGNAYVDGDAHVEGALHVNGNLTFSKKKSYISIPPSAFQPEENLPYTNLGYQLSYTGPTGYKDFYAPVSLPHNATITALTFYYWSNVADGNGDVFTFRFLRSNFQTVTGELVAFKNGYLDDPSYLSYTAATIDYALVDNSRYTYCIELNMCSGYCSICGVRIEYEFTEPY